MIEPDAQSNIPLQAETMQPSQSIQTSPTLNSAESNEINASSSRHNTDSAETQCNSSDFGVAKKTLKRQRSGKKGAVTRRVNVLNSMIQTQGSRTRIKFIAEELTKSLENAAYCHEQYMLMLDENDPEFTDDWIEDLRMKVDLCISSVQEYLKGRIDEPPSDISSLHCSNWLSSGSISGSVNFDEDLLSISDHDERQSTAIDREIESLSTMFTEMLQPWSQKAIRQDICQNKSYGKRDQPEM